MVLVKDGRISVIREADYNKVGGEFIVVSGLSRNFKVLQVSIFTN